MSFEISLYNVKSIAKNLKAELSERGFEVKYADSLEILAKELGFRNWNTFLADLNKPPRVSAEGSVDAAQDDATADSAISEVDHPESAKEKNYWWVDEDIFF